MDSSSPRNNAYSDSGKDIVPWIFLQPKKLQKSSFPTQCFLHSCTQIGSKILIYGGSDYNGEAIRQLFIFDTISLEWSVPTDESEFQEDHPGSRYGHTATLIGLHPPKIFVYGGMVGRTNTYEFDSPDGMEAQGDARSQVRSFMNWRRRGKKNGIGEEADDSVYFLEMTADKWKWNKPLTIGGRAARPIARAEHSASKSSTNEMTIFGGWTDRPSNEMWIFHTVDLEWRQVTPEAVGGERERGREGETMTGSGSVWPRPRYRHTSEVIGGELYILGGADNGSDVAEGARHLSLHVYNYSRCEWRHPSLSGANPFPRSGHDSEVIGGRSIVVFGGKRSNEVYLNDIILIDISSFSCSSIRTVESTLPTPISNLSLSLIGNAVYVFGGTDVRGNCYNEIRTLDIGGYLDSSDILVSEGARSDYSFKILIIGDAAVGKSALLTRFSEDIFLDNYQSTIGIDFNTRLIRVERKICKLEMWDTAGQERFSTITANYYRGAQGALLVYDVSLRSSFEHVITW
eukprot:CAMPEP_0182423810 /NCGR_PEP_ID=MMETSP1167-20130531/9879_1 /TAXON_ID=2988 /ORGANISM="Mallomonas Sp, Strain CCMP3275" /LENGTH=515 /DNA_ID=CAMNT_0024603093 /DNA_START=62 /DNA_END=1606 /DNA_ORIENTATION=+